MKPACPESRYRFDWCGPQWPGGPHQMIFRFPAPGSGPLSGLPAGPVQRPWTLHRRRLRTPFRLRSQDIQSFRQTPARHHRAGRPPEPCAGPASSRPSLRRSGKAARPVRQSSPKVLFQQRPEQTSRRQAFPVAGLPPPPSAPHPQSVRWHPPSPPGSDAGLRQDHRLTMKKGQTAGWKSLFSTHRRHNTVPGAHTRPG